jgi:hypothetical protein
MSLTQDRSPQLQCPKVATQLERGHVYQMLSPEAPLPSLNPTLIKGSNPRSIRVARSTTELRGP